MKAKDKVLTPQGEGVIVFVRNGPPDYNTPEAVSVILDSKRNAIGYSGTMFLAKEVKPI